MSKTPGGPIDQDGPTLSPTAQPGARQSATTYRVNANGRNTVH